MLGVAVGVSAEPWGCGADAFQARSDWRHPWYAGKSENRGAASAAARFRPPRPRALPTIPRAGSLREAAPEQASGGGGCCGPGAERKVLAGPTKSASRCAERPFFGSIAVCRVKASRAGRAAVARTRPRAPAQHHVFCQVRLLRPLRLVHGTGVSPGGADPAPGPASWHVPSP